MNHRHIADRHSIAEQFLGAIEWEAPDRGFLRCPGEQAHTTRTKQRDCMIRVDGTPTLSCFHSSCATAVRKANRRLRSAIGKASPGDARRLIPTPEDMTRWAKKRQALIIKQRATISLPMILRDYAWTPADAREESPTRLLSDPSKDWPLILSLFDPTDTIWIGNIYDSCKDNASDQRKTYCRRFFRSVADWLRESKAPAQFICPSVFKPGIHSRSNQNVVQRRYLVVESDTLSKDQVCAVFRWCRQFMRLQAIVDTAGKSLHGWFDYPDDDVIEELKVILPALGFDPALFKPSQPCRLPGARRGDRAQSLIWFGGRHE